MTGGVVNMVTNETLDPTKGREFLDYLSDYSLLKKILLHRVSHVIRHVSLDSVDLHC